MFEINVYNIGMQLGIDISSIDLGWNYEPYGEHSDILNINGCLHEKRLYVVHVRQ